MVDTSMSPRLRGSSRRKRSTSSRRACARVLVNVTRPTRLPSRAIRNARCTATADFPVPASPLMRTGRSRRKATASCWDGWRFVRLRCGGHESHARKAFNDEGVTTKPSSSSSSKASSTCGTAGRGGSLRSKEPPPSAVSMAPIRPSGRGGTAASSAACTSSSDAHSQRIAAKESGTPSRARLSAERWLRGHPSTSQTASFVIDCGSRGEAVLAFNSSTKYARDPSSRTCIRPSRA